VSLLDLIDAKRPEILRIAAKHGAKDLRLFGSVARGEEHEGSDVDLLAEMDGSEAKSREPWRFPEQDIQEELEELLGVHVDVVRQVDPIIRDQVLEEAIPLGIDDFRVQAVLRSQRPRPALDRNRLHVTRMRAAADAAAEYAGVSRDALDAEPMRRHALIGVLTQLGESAKAVSPDYKASHPEIPWQQIVDFRNIAVHNYYDLDWERVWRITQADIPALKTQLEKLV
jgi:uncharacterized protein